MAYSLAEAKAFIAKIAPMMVKEGKARGYKVISTAIAQAIIEGAAGTSKLASAYHNHFGMKCGSSWGGKSVNLSTKEEYKAGVLTDIKANFRVYDSDEEGVKGYYDFISKPRYANLKSAQNYKHYAQMLKADGYATSSTYVDTLCKTVERYGLTVYDEPKDILIGQASLGESGKVSGNVPGNQTGGELNFRKYYAHQKGWRAFRVSNAYASSLIAYAMLRAVKNDCIGYDQQKRNELYIASQKYGFDPGLVKVDVSCDCSALVRVCCAHAKIALPDFTTANEAKVLANAGFAEVEFDHTTGAGLQIGDILVTKTKGHTVVVVQA